MNKTFLNFILFISILVFMYSCKSFMYGFTEDEAMDRYMKVSKVGNSFGYKRLSYNLGHHGKRSQLYELVAQKGLPEFIYEYNDSTSCDGIILYYIKADSAFVFKEEDQDNPTSTQFLNSRKINDVESEKFKNPWGN